MKLLCKKKRRLIIYAAIYMIFLLSALTGCKLDKTSEEKLKDLDYTVCDESRLPHELINLIKRKRNHLSSPIAPMIICT